MTSDYFLKSLSHLSNDGLKTPKEKAPFVKRILSIIMFLLIAMSMQSQTTFTSVQSGNYNDPATWGTATAPTSIDHVVISSGNTVLLNDWFTANNVTINGELDSSEASWEFIVNGNLTVANGGLFKGIYLYSAPWGSYNKGIQLTVAGNITNNGRIDLSEGSSYEPQGVLNMIGTTVQTVSGLGTFGGTFYTTDNTNNGAVINQLIINNTAIATPNVVWGFNNIKIKSAITLTNARVELGTNKMTIGNYGTANTVCMAGNGFLSGTIGRWYSNYDNLTSIPSGIDYNSDRTVFPFISVNGKSRSAFISRPTDNSGSGTAGELSVAYYDAPGVSSGFSVVDGGYTVTDIYEGAWVIAKDANYTFPMGNHSIAFSAEEAYLIMNGNSRIVKADGTVVGTHQSGTITPFASRIGLADTDLDNVFQVGYNAALDTPITSVQSGNWNDAATWSTNSIPACGDTVTILPGHTITVNSVSSAAGVNIAFGATLVSESSSLTVGCTNNNAAFSNRGTYTINGGSLIVNGNVLHADGSTFNQIGGDIIVDGNHNGDAATSTDQTLFKIGESSLNLTAGKITIVDPAVTSTTPATAHTITSIEACIGWFCWFPTNIFVDAVDGIEIGQVIVGNGIPAGTVVAGVNMDGSINTNPSLPVTGLSLPLSISFHTVNKSPSTFTYESNNHYTASVNHTLQMGDGVSTEKSAVTTNGFNCNFRVLDGAISLGNLIVNAPDATDRFVNLDPNNYNYNVVMNVQNDFTLVQGKLKGINLDTYFGGNIVNNGAMNLTNMALGNYLDGSFVATSLPQTISGTGTFNAQADVILNTEFNTGSVTQLKVNNESNAGVTFMIPFNVVNGLIMENGIIHTSATSVLKVGTPSLAYTAYLSGNFGANCYIDGPFAKDISGGQNATALNDGSGLYEKFFFPVGKSFYAPIWVGVTTPDGGFESPGANIKVEAFDTNTGTESTNIAHLSQNRWEVSKTAGTVTDFNIRLADPTAIETSIIVQAPSASGVYDNDFGITATYETLGGLSTLTSTTDPLPFSGFEGYFSTARQAECTAVNPGSTIASETNVCNGKSVDLSLENIVVGEGIGYQWQSSTNGIDYTDIPAATATSCSATPLTNTYYRCNVTCYFSSTTVPSTPIQITLNNTILTTTPATICLPTDTAILLATSSAGDVKWYASQTGGAALATGNSFTTPVLASTTTFYAGTESTTNGTAGFTYTEDGYGNGGLNKGVAFNLSNATILNSVKVYPQQNPGGTGPMPITVKVFQNGVQVPGTSEVVFTPNTFSSWSPTTTAQTVTLGYQLPAGDNYSLEITDGGSYDNALAYVSVWPNPFPVTNGAVTITGGINNGSIDVYSYYYFFNWDITEVCSSARVAVTATVQTPEECDLGNPSAQLLNRVVAYPNPYSQTFKLDIQTNNPSDVVVNVYDMVGRLIEHRAVSFNDISNVEIGNGYPSGIYNVTVTQEGKAKTLQVIKR
ncbi:Ig-like domain-containing protein [Flavobacterium terrisoli]|uniref:Ig-like domain-containing protein n=1 Tax=Flavobacterium terrisoli TaxID=3242195 RepID=UPI002543FAD0|nr:T9SS type A sorting domain-containing protein [Flavobacterium buctense]